MSLDELEPHLQELRRLEKQGHLTRHWDTGESRPRKLYETSKQGLHLAQAMRNDWQALTASIHALGDDSLSDEEK